LHITDTTASTTTATGCAILAGGLGVAGAINAGGASGIAASINTQNGGQVLNLTNSFPTSTTVLNDPMPVLRLWRNGTSSQSYEAMALFSLDRYENSSTAARTRLSIHMRHATSDYANIMQLYSSGCVKIPTNIASTTTATGSFVIAGGLGAAGAINAGGAIKTTDTTSSTDRYTGSIIAGGGIGATGAINAGGGISSAARITGATMTCTTAPAVATDVVRLTDISALLTVTTLSATGTGWAEDGVSPDNLSALVLYRIGQVVTACAASQVQITSTTANNIKRHDAANIFYLPVAWRPTRDSVYTVIQCIVNTSPIEYTMTVSVNTDGSITIARLNGSAFASSAVIAMVDCCFQYFIV
jgi:hypothetical protein